MVLFDKKINGIDFEKIENYDMDRSAGIETVKLGGKWYALSGWNGEKYYDCWEIEFSGYVGSPISDETFILEPVEIPVGEPDEDGDYIQYDVIGYIFC